MLKNILTNAFKALSARHTKILKLSLLMTAHPIIAPKCAMIGRRQTTGLRLSTSKTAGFPQQEMLLSILLSAIICFLSTVTIMPNPIWLNFCILSLFQANMMLLGAVQAGVGKVVALHGGAYGADVADVLYHGGQRYGHYGNYG